MLLTTLLGGQAPHDPRERLLVRHDHLHPSHVIVLGSTEALNALMSLQLAVLMATYSLSISVML